MKEYKVVLSIQAKEDYKRIISYIKNKLLEPNIAEIYAELIKDEFNILKYNPQKFAIIDYDLLKKYKFRRKKVEKTAWKQHKKLQEKNSCNFFKFF